MNKSTIKKTLGQLLRFEGVFLLVPAFTAFIYSEKQIWSYLAVAVVCWILGYLLAKGKTDPTQVLYMKEGFLIVGLSWVILSLIGAIPFVLCGDIPSYIDALFEIVSGFTTTGSSILTDVEALSHASLMWRSFSHWVGGMGVFVLLLAVLPNVKGYTMHLMKAESPGPSVGKLVPRVGDTARILYIIYFALTAAEIIFLIIAGMPIFDAFTTGFGTAGTGGFGIKADSIAGYSNLIQWIVTIFMILFGVNFNAYFFLLGKNKKDAFRIEEVRWYFAIILIAIAVISINIIDVVGAGNAFRLASFQVGSIITTTGFATADFNLWPQLSKTILVMLMFCGACAGSTGGGIKVSRIMVLVKSIKVEVNRYIHPHSVKTVKMDNAPLDKETLRSTSQYFLTYAGIMVASFILVAIDNFDFETTITSVIATLNNIGPGLGLVGPAGSFAQFSWFSKIVLIIDMLAGRLELYPMLVLFVPSLWKFGRKKNAA